MKNYINFCLDYVIIPGIVTGITIFVILIVLLFLYNLGKVIYENIHNS